jgi:hypothetical protein
MTIPQFLFGGGWWTIWYVGLWLMLPACIYLLWWFSIVKPDGGPQGGELSAGLLLLFLLVWTVATLVHSLLFAATQPGGFARYPKWAGIWIVLWSFTGWVFYKLTNLAASTSASLFYRRLGMIGFAIAVVALYAANFWLLARFRSRMP